MKIAHHYLVSLLATFAFTACASERTPDATYPGVVKKEFAADFENAESCDAETPCTNGLSCIYFPSENLETPICISDYDACEALDCGDGACLILESYPGQVVCSSLDDSDGGDDTGVCNTPNGDCPSDPPDNDDPIGEPGEDCLYDNCTEPGYPGDGPEGTEPGSPGGGTEPGLPGGEGTEPGAPSDDWSPNG